MRAMVLEAAAVEDRPLRAVERERPELLTTPAVKG